MTTRRGRRLELHNAALAQSMYKLLRVLRSDVTENAAVILPDAEWISLERIRDGSGKVKFVIELHGIGVNGKKGKVK